MTILAILLDCLLTENQLKMTAGNTSSKSSDAGNFLINSTSY